MIWFTGLKRKEGLGRKTFLLFELTSSAQPSALYFIYQKVGLFATTRCVELVVLVKKGRRCDEIIFKETQFTYLGSAPSPAV